jgi:hypothetical protein
MILKVALESVSFNDPRKSPLFQCHRPKEITSGAEAKSLAVEQVVSPVRMDGRKKLYWWKKVTKD